MPKAKARRVEPRAKRPVFEVEAFLRSAGAARRVATYPKGKVVFSQGHGRDDAFGVNFFMNKFRDLGFIE